MATEEVAGMKVSTVLIIVVVLYFLSQQISKTTGAINNAARSADKLSKPANDIGSAISDFINAGSSALGSWLKGSGGSSSTNTSRTAPGTSSTWTGDQVAEPDWSNPRWNDLPSSWTGDQGASDGNLYV